MLREQNPRKASIPSEDQLIAVEKLLADERNSLQLRFEAGVILCGAYTSKRWSCLQRLKPGSLKLTADALHGTSWKQKSKKKRRTVAALSFCAWRSGISLDDWAGTWFRVRSAYAAQIGFNEEQADFLVPIKVNGRIGAASGEDSKLLFQRVFTAAGYPNDRFTMHGLRAFLNTAASQLMIDKSTRETLGAWGRNSDMVTEYDRTTGTAELHLRSSILSFFRDGGRLGKNFELPKFHAASHPGANSQPRAARPAPVSRPKRARKRARKQ